MMTNNNGVEEVINLCIQCNTKSIHYKSQRLCKKCYNQKRYEKLIKCIDCNQLRPHQAYQRCTKCHRKYRSAQSPLKRCECGYCIDFIPSINQQGKPAKYVRGHSQKGINNHMYNKKHTKEAIKKIRMTYRPMPKKSRTKIERIVEQELLNRGILFFLQKGFVIKDFIHPVDIFIPPNICIELDSVYYHTKIIRDNYSPLQRDYLIDAELENQGCIVIRFWEQDIYQNLQWVMNQISKLIDKDFQVHEYVYCKCGCNTKIPKYSLYGKKRLYALYHGTRKDMSNRICLLCKTKDTYIKADGRPQWVPYEKGFICRKCSYKIIYRNSKKTTV